MGFTKFKVTIFTAICLYLGPLSGQSQSVLAFNYGFGNFGIQDKVISPIKKSEELSTMVNKQKVTIDELKNEN